MSVVVPTLDEARALPRLLARLAWLPVEEVVVVDGGSHDATVELARAAGARVVLGAPRGRGSQLQAGLEAARGDVVWFLHADALPALDALDHLAEALDDPGVVGGAFLLHTRPAGGRVPLGPLLRLADLRSRATRLPYGDQAIFCRRAPLRAAGGVPCQPVFEDLELSRRLWSLGRVITVPCEVSVSGRRFEDRPLAALTAMHVLPALYRAGVPPARLVRWYRPVR